jgi:hypothetical protein
MGRIAQEEAISDIDNARKYATELRNYDICSACGYESHPVLPTWRSNRYTAGINRFFSNRSSRTLSQRPLSVMF